MTAEHIIGIYVVSDETMRALGHTRHRRAGVRDAEALTVAVGAAAFYGNHHARTLAVLRATGYLSRALSTARFSRRIHALADWLALRLDGKRQDWERKRAVAHVSLRWLRPDGAYAACSSAYTSPQHSWNKQR